MKVAFRGAVVELEDPVGIGPLEASRSASYAQTFSAGCSGSIAVGETKTCTVTNAHTAVTSTSTAQSPAAVRLGHDQRP